MNIYKYEYFHNGLKINNFDYDIRSNFSSVASTKDVESSNYFQYLEEIQSEKKR